MNSSTLANELSIFLGINASIGTAVSILPLSCTLLELNAPPDKFLCVLNSLVQNTNKRAIKVTTMNNTYNH